MTTNYLPTFCRTRNFITAFTSAGHLSVTWPAQSNPYPHIPLPKNPFLYYLPSTPGSPQWFFPLRFPHQIPVQNSTILHTRYMPRLSHYSRFYHPHNIGWVRNRKLLIWSFLHSPVTSSLLGRNNLLNTYSQTTTAYVPTSMWTTKFHTHSKLQAKLYFCAS
jgi:hypothetical protein